MKSYELVIVLDSNLEMEQIEDELKRLQTVVTEDGGTVRKWERWGKRRLAYEIMGRQYGYYVLVVFDVKPERIVELVQLIRHNASIIRHLITALDPGRIPEIDAQSVRTLGAEEAAREETSVEASSDGAGPSDTEVSESKSDESTAAEEPVKEMPEQPEGGAEEQPAPVEPDESKEESEAADEIEKS